MPDDRELLRRYTDDASEEAFRELVQRRIGLVFATALRVLGDAHSADEVAQVVFVAMARKARTLVNHPALSGWLHRSARYAAINFQHQQRRRAAIEREAFAMVENNPLGSGKNPADPIDPFLDELLDRLNERERHAVVLRFLEECSFAQIASR